MSATEPATNGSTAAAPAQNPDYNKFDLCKDKNVPEEDVRRMHSAVVEKKSFLGLNKVVPAQRDPMLGLQLDQKEDGTIVVTGMKLLSPFQNTRLEVGNTIACINGITGPWASAEAAEQVIKDAENKVHLIFADLKDGHFMEFVSFNKDGTPYYPPKPDVKHRKTVAKTSADIANETEQQDSPMAVETNPKSDGADAQRQMEPLMTTGPKRDVPMGADDPGNDMNKGALELFFEKFFPSNPEFFLQAFKFACCFCGLQASYLTWGYMQELIMTTQFTPTENVPDGKFPSAAFCVFSNRFLAVIVAMIAVKIKHGSVFANNKAPLLAFTPCALSNTMSSWSQYASLKYVSFPVQTVFKSSKIIPVMMMGKFLKGTSYPISQYVEALLITLGVAIFSVASKQSDKENSTEFIGLIFLLLYISFDSFTSQWQDKVYTQYGRPNVDPYQMMLGVNSSAIVITTIGLIVSGDFPVVHEFLKANPQVFTYNVITAITSASGQLCIFYTIKEFGPIVFTIIMTTRQMFSICISAIVFGHPISAIAALGAILVFSVLFYQIRRKYLARKATSGGR